MIVLGNCCRRQNPAYDQLVFLFVFNPLIALAPEPIAYDNRLLFSVWVSGK
jgi:hypothetical protein